MKSTITTAIIAVFLAATIGTATAATVTCTVETVKDGIVTLNCGDKADKIREGVKVKVKTTVKKRKAIEGC